MTRINGDPNQESFVFRFCSVGSGSWKVSKKEQFGVRQRGDTTGICQLFVYRI